MEQFLYDFSLFKWAWTGPIYWGNFLTFFGGFFVLMLLGWLFQRGINPFKVIYFSLFNIIYYIVRLFIVHIINNVNLRNKLLIVLILLLFIPNEIIRFIIILILSFIIINQNMEYKKKNYIKEYKFGKKVYFLLYIIALIISLFILKYTIFIKVVPVLIVIIHILYWFKSKK